MMPNDMRMKGLRRNDAAMKSKCRYHFYLNFFNNEI